MDETRRERRAPDAGRPERNVPPREEDPHATPLGRGADPGEVRGTHPLSGGPSVAGRRGHGVAGERGGPGGFVDRENEDARQEARDGPPVGQASKTNDADA